MDNEFKEMLMKRAKEQGKVDPAKLKAKASMMKELSDMLGSDMKDSISKGMKKVTVASDSDEGLETGLELAKKKLEHEASETPEQEMEEHEDDELEDMEDSENYSDDMPASEDDELAKLEAKIAELKAKKILDN